MTDATLPAAPERKTILGHPRGLVVLFFAEMWERFSYYGMRTLLVLFLVQHMLFEDTEAQGLYAAYAALVYLTPIIGGAIADRWLGARKAVTIGALLLVAGHFAMAFEGPGGKQFLTIGGTEYTITADGRGQDRQLIAQAPDGARTPITISPEGVRRDAAMESTLPEVTPVGQFQTRVERDIQGEGVLFLALSLIICGVGFLKANISAVVGELYSKEDPRRDSGFTLFYVGVNLGSLLSQLACGWIGIAYGWKYGFGLAGIGMLLGLVVFQLGQPWLEGRAGPPDPEKLKQRVLGVPLEALFWIGGVVAVAPVWLLIQRQHLVEQTLLWVAPGLFVAMILYTVIALRGEVRSRMLVALILSIFSVLFWTLFEQAGSSLTLFADRSVTLPAWLTAGQAHFVNPLCIILLGPLFAAMWQGLGRRGLEPPTPYKFSIALALVGAGFLVLVWAIETQAGPDFRVAFTWLALAYVIHSVAELFLSPIGLSMITKLSAPRIVGLMLGVWFLSSALAHTLAGIVAKATSAATVGGVVVDPAAQLETYQKVFGEIGWAAVITGGVLLLASPVLKKMMAGVR
ncbi:MAG: peptide MFS transporter [Caulobacteraceae bacterium]|nr:peptide MFS transporter [Caulobacteraceae bacterium]